MSGIAALWNDGVLTKSEKAEIMRLMIERVTVEVIGDSERVKVDLLWLGGARARAEIRRPVRNLRQLSYYEDLRARIAALKSEGKNQGEIAAVLNAAGWRPARKDTFTAASLQAFARRSATGEARGRKRRRPAPVDRGRDEWMLEELVEKTGVPKPTLYGWILKGKLKARKEERGVGGSRRRWLVQADQDTFNAIRTWRDGPARQKTNQRTPDFRSASTTH